MAKYEGTAGATGTVPRSWPAEAKVALDPDRPTLLMFAHPQCPCTEATIGELNRLLVRCGGRATVRVLFFAPEHAAEDWTQTDLWKSAAAIPGVSVQIDRDGKTARNFGAQTSGQVVLYDSRGELLFQGGITAGRGHAGDNAGADAIVSRLRAGAGERNRTAVFGCSLLNRKRTSTQGAD